MTDDCSPGPCHLPEQKIYKDGRYVLARVIRIQQRNREFLVCVRNNRNGWMFSSKRNLVILSWCRSNVANNVDQSRAVYLPMFDKGGTCNNHGWSCFCRTLIFHTGYPCIQALVGPTYKMAFSHGLEKTLMQIMVAVTRSRYNTRQRWEKHITDTFGTMAAASRVAEDRHQFRKDI